MRYQIHKAGPEQCDTTHQQVRKEIFLYSRFEWMKIMAVYQAVLLAAVLAVTSCQSPPVVNTPSGPIKGIVVPTLGKDVVQFRNIPYAKPPIGKLRFEKTVPIEPWTETLDGTVFGPSCLQDVNGLPEMWIKAENNITSEDCLQLNVYVPGAVSKTTKKPVMFWLHGGGFRLGNNWFLDPSFLVFKDVIVVTTNYRLGLFGFLSTGDAALPGNYGLWDMIEALKWVNKNIASFGGDPESVTIFGESAGGFAVSYLSIIPSNEGLFHRVISQSGVGIGEIWSVMDPFKIAKRIGSHVGCITENDSTIDKNALVSCLKEKPAEVLIKAQIDPSTLDFGGVAPVILWPNIDGELIVRKTHESLDDVTSKESIFFRSLDVMAGTTDNEATLIPFLLYKLEQSRKLNFSEGIPTAVLCEDLAPVIARDAFNDETFVSDLICQAYKEDSLEEQSRSICNLWADVALVAPTLQFLDFHSRGKTNTNTYQYLFTQEISFYYLFPSLPWSKGAGHAVDLLYLFGPGTFNQLDESLASPEGRAMTEILVNYWTNFAKTGNPNGDKLVEWKKFGSGGRNYMNLNMEPFMDKDLYAKRMKFLLEEIPDKLRKSVKTELYVTYFIDNRARINSFPALKPGSFKDVPGFGGLGKPEHPEKNHRPTVSTRQLPHAGFELTTQRFFKMHPFLCLILISGLVSFTSCQPFPTVNTPSGPIKGVVVPALGMDIVQFRNIPFAKPPVGNLRFEKPLPVEPWTETLDGTAFGPSCMQDKLLFADLWEKAENAEVTEDCLQLNVYVPGEVSAEVKKPVMVWIYGGAFTMGSTLTYDGSFLASKDVLVVTVNYRLGIFGFLSTEDAAMPGNYGLWDMIEALKWINKNIASFGGDPDSVTVFGESAGGFAASYLAVMPNTAGLFQRFISQSGSAVGFVGVAKNPARAAKATGKFVGCIADKDSDIDTSALANCLKQKSAEELMNAQRDPGTQFFGSFSVSPLLWPTIDGELLPRSPFDSLSDPASKESIYFRSLDMIAGTTSNEASVIAMFLGWLQEPLNFSMTEGMPTAVLCDVFAPTLAREMFNDNPIVSDLLCKEYSSDDMEEQARKISIMHADTWFVSPTVQLLDFHANGKSSPRTYQYLYNQIINFTFMVPRLPWMEGAGHATELLYMFGPTGSNSVDESLSTIEGRTFSDILARYWTNFAKTGNPNEDGLVPWKPFSSESRDYMELKYQPVPRQNLYEKRMKFLLEEIPNKIKNNVKTEL
ncbi:uncharacterized protein LOC117317000 [Pecten maximus]|uniref:uncharacterized protein LOC117317000 n=1 Tax=Pecten maximus TaxID=6579 RepID=UPI001458B9E3|nr:uncharacterized protein LOC117317000 [Pecten maximus]